MTCGTNSTVSSTLPYVNQAAGSEDFHVNCTSVAKNYVAPNGSAYQLAYDKDAAWLTPDGPRNAGSEAESSCGT